LGNHDDPDEEFLHQANVSLLPYRKSHRIPLSYSLPMTWAVKLIRGTFDANFTGKEYLHCLMVLMIEVIIFTAVFQMLYKIIERQVKINASLELM